MARFATCAVVLAAVLITTGAARAVDVTTCGQVLDKRAQGELVADLDCPQQGNPLPSAVTLGAGATLSLNGFTLSGAAIGVRCTGTCRIEGPGTIDGFSLGILGGTTVRVTNVVVSNTSQAIQSTKLQLTGVGVVQAAGTGILAEVLKAEQVTVDQARYGLMLLKRGVATDLSVTNSGARGISGLKFKGDRVTVTGSGEEGSLVDRLALRDSTVTGNGVFTDGVDIRSSRFPKLIATTCGLSQNAVTGLPFGVCTLD